MFINFAILLVLGVLLVAEVVLVGGLLVKEFILPHAPPPAVHHFILYIGRKKRRYAKYHVEASLEEIMVIHDSQGTTIPPGIVVIDLD